MVRDYMIKKNIIVFFHQRFLDLNGFEIAVSLKNYFPEQFKSNPIIFPHQENAPPDFPYLILNEQSCNLQISKESTKFEFYNTSSFDCLINVARQIPKVLESFDLSINRIGFLIIGNLELSKESIDVIRENYFKASIFTDIFQAEVHYFMKPIINNTTVNRWVRIKSKDSERNSLSVTIDTNTIVGEDALEHIFIEKFIDNVLLEVSSNYLNILKLKIGDF